MEELQEIDEVQDALEKYYYVKLAKLNETVLDSLTKKGVKLRKYKWNELEAS